VSLALTLIKGDQVDTWTELMGNWIDRLRPHENIPAVWDAFLREFTKRFQDAGAEQKARTALEKLRMSNNEIDQYIANFEEEARKAGYTTGSPELTQRFLKGLPTTILKDIVKTPVPHTYEETKQRAIDSVVANQALYNLLAGRGDTRLPVRPWQDNRRPQQGRPYNNNQQWRQPQRQYNSTNAPRSMNNVPVPMDLDKARAAAAAQQAGQKRDHQGRRVWLPLRQRRVVYSYSPIPSLSSHYIYRECLPYPVYSRTPCLIVLCNLDNKLNSKKKKKKKKKEGLARPAKL
jgi:hypothetical protein